MLNHPLIPEFKGREKFKGKQIHTAKWDQKYDLENKKVACIGTGASAAQLLPEIYKIV